ncbi:hypothetical protein L9F63_003174, partial [Diploptera punctata]
SNGTSEPGGDSPSPPAPSSTQTQQLLSASMMTPPYPGVMYQTSQGMVYAAASPSALSNGVIFSLNQAQLQLQRGGGSSSSASSSSRQQQFITIPLPMLSAVTASANGHHQEAADLTKSRK